MPAADHALPERWGRGAERRAAGQSRPEARPAPRLEAALPVAAGAAAAVDWKRNLAALWVAEFMAIFGFSFALPFLPLYLGQDLGVSGPGALALWSGVAAGVSGLGMAIASPIWGVLADRHGRKSMLIRAMVGGAISVGLMGAVHTAWQLVLLRAVQGAASGTVPAATALVAAETPRRKVAWALGLLGSAVALGGALAPLVGGIAATFFGLRAVFIAGGVLLAGSVLPVLVFVGESPLGPARDRAAGGLAALRRLGRPLLLALGVLVAGQLLMQFSYAATQQMAVLRLMRLDPAGASAATGAAFGAAGLATAAAAALYARFVRRTGFRWFAAATALLMAAAIASAALAGSVALTVAAVALFGLFYGGLSPALSTLIGLRTPREVQSTVYGLSASAIAAGFALGPFVGGAVAATSAVAVSLWLAAAVSALLAVLLAAAVREPS